MENVEIANVLEEVAGLLEIQGANPFRVRAYRTAVRTVGDLTRPLAEMVEAGEDLRELPGIGEDISQYITELVRTGRLTLLDELLETTPGSLVQLMRIEGLGPKRARTLHDELDVRSTEDLEQAIDAGKVQELRGFGDKTVEKLSRAIQDLKREAPRFKLSDADQLVRPLLEYMGSASGLDRIEASGSYRRRRETVGDIDLLAICPKSEPVMEHFTSYKDIERVLAAGKTRGTVVLKSGLQVDLRVLGRRAYGAALHYFTGSKAHNIAVRRLGIERGLRISEYGVFRVPRPKGRRKAARRGQAKRARAGGEGKPKWIAGEREEDVFKAVGMAWVPPELREDNGEIEAALEDRLPTLVEPNDIRGDLQMHTTWTDGTDSIEDMARACLERGYRYLAITDHSKAMAMTKGLGPKQLEAQWAEIDRVRRKLKRIEILKGLEVDILRDGSLDLADDYLSQLDLVVVSIHSHMSISRAKMTDRVIKAISHPAVHILAHPTGRIINRRNPYDIDIEAVLAAAAKSGVAVELNAQPDRLDLDHVYVRRAKELGVPVVVNTDAHSGETLRFMSYGVEQARRGWLEATDVLNTRNLRELRAWLARRKRRPRRRRSTGARATRASARPRTRRKARS